MSKEGLSLVKNAKEVLAQLEAAKAEEQRFDLDAKQLKKRLDAEQQFVSDTIRQTISARRGEIEETYRKENGKVLDKQKKVKAERSKAKAAGVKNRIEEETADLREENRCLRKKLQMCMKQSKVPSYCNSMYYYAMYFTKGVVEATLLLLTLAMVFLVIPIGIYWMIPGREMVHLLVIYIAVLVLFFGAYILIGNLTKDKHMDTLREGRKIRDVMRNNRRRIRAITRTIEKDRDEAGYSLEDYDQTLRQIDKELDRLAKAKDDALTQFDRVTVLEIEREITGNSQAKIEGLEAELKKSKEKLEISKAKVQEFNLILTDKYIPYLGREYMNAKALNTLAGYLENGQAANLTEAKNLYVELNSNR